MAAGGETVHLGCRVFALLTWFSSAGLWMPQAGHWLRKLEGDCWEDVTDMAVPQKLQPLWCVTLLVCGYGDYTQKTLEERGHGGLPLKTWMNSCALREAAFPQECNPFPSFFSELSQDRKWVPLPWVSTAAEGLLFPFPWPASRWPQDTPIPHPRQQNALWRNDPFKTKFKVT